MNEAETRAEHIDPALKAAGWGVIEGSRIRREYSITLGRIEGHGKRGKALTADYVLEYRNTKLAVIEAKAWNKLLTEGVGQAKDYAGKLAVRFTYATNGQGIYGIDMHTGVEGELAQYPTPEELWSRTFAVLNRVRDRFAAVPYPDKGGSWAIRFYQEIAVNRVLEAITEGGDRILLTLATGTGKTSIAFQIAWKLFQTRWNLSDGPFDRLRMIGEPTRRPRILFLADRNTLADQAYNDFSSFAAFSEDALVRIDPADIRKKGKVPKNGSIFFTIFQTFMSGPGSNTVRPELVEGFHNNGLRQAQPERSFYFGEYPPDFFDFIVIDECHRGGANDEGNWRGILNHFTPAVQLGLTATPKRKDNVDTYAYFGEPVFAYSLKGGINDGFLTPFRVRQISTTLDEYIYTADDCVMEGEVEYGKLYKEADFNKIIEIKEREKKRVEIFMSQIDQRQKTLVFCATQEHALAMRDLINQMTTSSNPNYCQRVTANDGALGEQYLRDFQDNEKTIPTILTTSKKLSTGVDARNIRNIVLMRPVTNMIEFKQIIGRGTRLYDGKDYFTIYDFVKAHHHFCDPEWDGEPVEPETCPKCGGYPCLCEKPLPQPCLVCNQRPCECEQEPCPKCGRHPCGCKKKAKVTLADGKERSIQYMTVTSFWHPDGTPMSAQQFMESLFGKLPEFFKNEAELRDLWSLPDTRAKLLFGLAEQGFGKEQLLEMQKIIDAENSDLFDVLAHVAYALPPLSREQRAARAKVEIHAHFNSKQQAFLDFVLAHYVKVGVEELDREKLTPLLRIKYHGAIADAVADLGRPEEIGKVFAGFQKYLYQHPK
ncbi:EcoAI/FtnUII family type I restriction enzme subunit R [Methylobacter tundripaludum]|uniref:Type I site-specific deoxyribonuclease n=1 Tax=Methylobacter tundripaludum (strain ATCC BAA-1195 / DSM 17260 / SV96) TaxID=697282 RepID=G3IWP6_METTV|nr:type I restriction endonuclease subunit R [Methylobacter tundripaludum]EGW23105.1 Type I site-specific deoxyribonuclease [Methylobacter tundripaludum SV96]